MLITPTERQLEMIENKAGGRTGIGLKLKQRLYRKKKRISTEYLKDAGISLTNNQQADINIINKYKSIKVNKELSVF